LHILFLSHYFPPEVNAPASRTFENCREWVRLGHEVTVVTCAPNHPRGQVYEGYRNSAFQRERMEGIEVVRVWTWLAANEGFLLRSLNYVSFMVSALVALPRLPRADVVVTTSPQFFNGLAGYFVRALRRIPWVFEVRDLWPESIIAVGAARNTLLIRMLEGLERFAYRKADYLVPVTDAFSRHMIARGVPARKISVIKNGADLRRFHDAAAQDLRAELGLGTRFVAAYFGTHGMAHGLDTLLDAAALLQSHDDIVFLMVGDGAERERLERQRNQRGLGNVVMLAQQPKERMPSLWRTADVSLVLLKDTPLFQTVIPSKIFESLAMQTPIVLGVKGESRELIEASGAGVAIAPGNATELAAQVLELSRNRARVKAMGAQGAAFVREHFDRAKLARRYADVLERAVQA
jgi:glycosyltransferase involved in cell wall biosynthesis